VTASGGLELGFLSLTEEVADCRLPLRGELPDWLDGALVRNGPARFEVGDDRVEHWFDGLGMLQRFDFDGTAVRYSNRFLRSETYERAMETGTLRGQFATGGSYLRRLWAVLTGRQTDNCNVHVAAIDGELLALTEVPRFLSVDPATLETRGEFTFADDLDGDLSLAHLVPDPHRGETIGLLTDLGRQSAYRLFRVADGTRRDDRTPTVPRSVAQRVEDRYGVGHLAPLAGIGHAAVAALREELLTVETGPSEDLPTGDYEGELRAAIADEYGTERVREVFPEHVQSRVVGRR